MVQTVLWMTPTREREKGHFRQDVKGCQSGGGTGAATDDKEFLMSISGLLLRDGLVFFEKVS